MAESPFAGPDDPQPAGAIGIGTGDLRVRSHPVVPVGRALLCREKRQYGGKRIDRKTLPCRHRQHLALEIEIVAGLSAAIDRLALGDDRLDAKIEELETV